ncbi:hypothetical protein [Kocuria palustris]|uniref:hypothetical protein n=1 Tax=Kocuria palustris TaxID=71999 RepID=UPI0011A17F9F|nr:hypothetical protein [Kocuria palustris]
MPQRHHTPEALADRVFTRGEAMSAGLSSRQLRHPHYERIVSGLWTPPDSARPRASSGPSAYDELSRLVHAQRLAMPDHAISHQSAALLWGFRLPRRLERAWPLHVTHIRGAESETRVKRAGLVGHRATNPLLLTTGPHGALLTGPTRTLVDIAGRLSDIELIAAVDGVICEHRHGIRAGLPALRSLAQVRDDLRQLTGTRGTRRVRRALERARVGVDSEPETRLRLLLEDHGLRGFRTDLELRSADGCAVHPDLADPGLRISLQYDGAHHDGQGQRERDVRRQRATLGSGWIEIRLTARDLVESEPVDGQRVPRAVALVLRAARSDRLGRTG